MTNLSYIRHSESETGAFFDILINGKEVGYAEITPANYVADITIYEEHRGQGIGTAALQRLSKDLGTLYLAPDNEGAERLYARIGSVVADNSHIYNLWGWGVDQGYGLYEI